ncbi:MAG: P-type conjugative transfer protein TrbL [Nitrosomonas sp. PRO4]|uniref:Type IV secretion system protein TrbL n=1 Tax=Nitrosomonas nitrosa TaxID=52442 RepID=A0A8H9DAM7_9PROT|nr:P-type conjugative transfer protein TrbL [Nitrosomonas nitrosa]MCB1934809.1 P-type conjugative transfer protein TrbL [Nitrosomonas sp.]MCE7913953.1 P-type conjugative transfer protein TrbL [Nitrosomonas sp. PRO4]CAE6508028.1 Type IV secretion system protein TrbL [Nitrosomonas nitrosa]
MLGNKITFIITLIILLCFSSSAFAELAYVDPVTNQSVLDQVVQKFGGKVKSWQTIVQGAAERLFWTLVLISMVWTFGMMLLRKADIGEFFAEFTRFIIFTGFFFWLLTNAVSGHNIAGTVIASMQQLGNSAAGLPGNTGHASVMNIGISIWNQATNNLTILQPVDSLIALIISLIILIVIAVIAVNMLLLLISAWVLMYAGIFLLGFGGARWTTDIAINYFKTVLGVGLQLFVMLLIVGIGSDLLSSFYTRMGKNVLNFEELAVMLVFTIALWVLISKLPPLISGIVTGSSIGSTAGIGSYSAGGLVAAAGTTAAITAYGVSTLRRNSPVKGIEPLMNAVKAGQNAENSGNYISKGGK